jgi:hypothetical protein
LPFAHIAATDVLVDKDIPLVHQGTVRTEGPAINRVAIGARSIGCPFHENRMGMGHVLWGIDDRVKADAVPHGDINFLFVEVVFDKIAFVVVPLALCKCGQQEKRKDKVSCSHMIVI